MPRFRRQCLDCHELTYKTRCDKHESERNRKLERERNTPERAAKKKFLYDATYRKNRALVLATATHCHLCKKLFTEGDSIQADHLYPFLGGASPLAAAHAHCNASRGNRPL
jgi:hypothetical protein